MFQLLVRVLNELISDIHIFGTLEHLRVHYVGYDRLVLAREIFV
jgi:hypothetical protein